MSDQVLGYGRSKSSRSRLWPLMSASLTILLIGCSAKAPPATIAAAPTSRVQAPPQPYDAFHGDLLDLIDAAVLMQRDRCMATAGYPELRDASGKPATGSFDDLKVTMSTFGATSEADARRIGFGMNLPAEPPAVRSTDQRFSNALDRCTQEANAVLGSNSQQVQDQYYELGNQLRTALRPVHTESMPAQFAAPVLACLEQMGFRPTDKKAWLKAPAVNAFGVPLGKTEAMPSDQWDRRGAIQVLPAQAARRYIPTSQEAELAAAWYRCTTSAGWPQYQLRQALALEATALRTHKSRLDELNPKIQTLAHQAAAISTR